MKLNELGLTKELFKRVSVECNGQTDEGRCGQGSLVGDTRNFMFGSTSVPLTSQSPDERPAFGFGG